MVVDFFGLGSSKSIVELSGSISDNLFDLFILIHGFILSSRVQDIQRSIINMSLQVVVFINQKVVDGFSFNVLELVMEMPEFHLRFTDSNKFSKFVFNIFVIENFKVVNFISSNSSIESNQEGFEERFSSFQIHVHDLNPEEEGNE